MTETGDRPAEPADPRRWIGTSWKMNKTLAEALAFADALCSALPQVDPVVQPFVVPPFTAARQVKAALTDTRVKVGAQNMHWEGAGAWTGEISPPMLKDCGLDLVEIGHSERRQHFGETNRTVGLKTAAALRHDLKALSCVGETLDERDSGRTEEVLREQVMAALGVLDVADVGKPMLFAYEPVWAIGVNGVPADAGYAGQQQRLIGTVASGMLPSRPPVLYGGSVTRENAARLIAEPGIDGLFVGRAAWHAEGFVEILRLAGGTS